MAMEESSYKRFPYVSEMAYRRSVSPSGNDKIAIFRYDEASRGQSDLLGVGSKGDVAVNSDEADVVVPIVVGVVLRMDSSFSIVEALTS